MPWAGGARATADEVALFEMRGDVIRSDKFDALSVKDGRLELRDYRQVITTCGSSGSMSASASVSSMGRSLRIMCSAICATWSLRA